ncbi:MAG TPA: alpha-amylase family glycosyl hydrolase, partial [Pyrinomonadaceae bacterium]|nr:alpha-amylase family glycosyl hydrolase [Pyrinomonadaceae bacterium]
ERTMPPAPDTPKWAREIVILEVFPEYFPGGFRELTKKLSFYKGVGFNTIYLMPHWVGGYSPIDLYRVEPSLGTADDLKEVVRVAHALGLRVLFDMVIHGFNTKSPIVTERPDLFGRDESGKLALHRTWKSVSTDWASAAYQQYMIDIALHDLKTYDIDGYRVDAASYKGAGWDARVPYPAYRSGSAAPELMTRMLRAMQEKKADTILLNEVFGPVFYSVSNLSHDNQTESPQLLLEKMEKGEYNAAHYKHHIANVFDALPAGANRVFYTRNHDTSWFYHFNGYTPRFMAMEAIHAFFGIPEVFAGDPKHKPGPEDDAGVYDYYRKLFAVRQTFPALVKGEVLLRDVECDNSQIFTGVRRLNNQRVLVAISLSDKEESATLRLPETANPARRGTKPKMRDVITGRELESGDSGSGAIKLKLKPFQVLVGRL